MKINYTVNKLYETFNKKKKKNKKIIKCGIAVYNELVYNDSL